MADPAYQQTVTRDALTLPALIVVLEGINRCLPDLPGHVRVERNIMGGRNLLIHTCAEYERALAEGTPLPPNQLAHSRFRTCRRARRALAGPQ